MADRNQTDVRFRLSAEGIEEVKAAFLAVEKQAEASGKGVSSLATRTASASTEATHTIEILTREIGIQLPRSVQTFLGSLEGVQGAMAAAFSITAIAAVVLALVKALPAIASFIDKLRGINDELFKAQAAVESMQQAVFAPKNVDQATAQVANLVNEIRRLQKANDEITGTGILKTLSAQGGVVPGFLKSGDLKENQAEIERLTKLLNDAEAARVGLAHESQVAADQDARALTDEIGLLSESANTRLKAGQLEIEQEARRAEFAVNEKVRLKDLTQVQGDQLLVLVKSKEQLQLQILANKDAIAAAQRQAEALKALQKSQTEFAKGAADNQLAILQANNKLASDEEQRSFNEGLINLDSFFTDKRNRIQQEADAERDIRVKEAEELSKQIEEAQSRPLAENEAPAARDQQVLALVTQRAKVLGDIDAKEIETQDQLLNLEFDRTDAARALAKEQLAAQAQLLSAENRRFDAERLDLDAQVAGLQRLKGESDEAFASRQHALSQAGNANIDFSEITAGAQRALASLDSDRRDIQNKVESGVLFEFQGQEQLAELEKSRLPVLRDIAQQLRDAADATGDPDKIEQARQFSQAIDEIAISSNRASQRMKEFKANVQQALTSDLTDFFTNGIQQAQSFGDAMRSLALSVVQSLQQIAAQMLATFIISKLLGGIFGGIGGGTLGDAGGIPGTGAGGAIAVAGGGRVLGPGTGTSDSIWARLSNGEFVVRAAVASRPDVLEALHHLNSFGELLPLRHVRHLEGFADGGPVEITGTPGAPGAAGPNGRLDAVLSLDEGLLLKRIEANPVFAKVLVRTLDKNRKSANAALGRR